MSRRTKLFSKGVFFLEVPKYIKQAVEKNASYAIKADRNNKLIRDWLEKQGVTVGEGANASDHEIIIDMLIDCVEQSHNADEFISFLENYELD